MILPLIPAQCERGEIRRPELAEGKQFGRAASGVTGRSKQRPDQLSVIPDLIRNLSVVCASEVRSLPLVEMTIVPAPASPGFAFLPALNQTTATNPLSP